MILDKAYQSAFCLPHFKMKTKSRTGHSMKCSFVGTLEYVVRNKRVLLTMTHDFESGANNIIKSLHVSMNYHDGFIPEVIYIQRDSCGKEKISVSYSPFSSPGCIESVQRHRGRFHPFGSYPRGH